MGKQEQDEELEALSFIYPQEFIQTSDNTLEITIKVEDNCRNEIDILLKAEFPPDYPDVSLVFSLEATEGEVGEQELLILQDKITEKMPEFLGLAMVFSIVEFIKTEIVEILNHKFTIEISADSESAPTLQDKIPLNKVTRESFMQWKENFSKEIRQLISEKKELSKSLKDFAQIEQIIQNSNKKITGRQMFERDQSLVNTDLLQSQDLDDDVVVDLQLFKGMDVEDLELEVDGIDLSED